MNGVHLHVIIFAIDSMLRRMMKVKLHSIELISSGIELGLSKLALEEDLTVDLIL